MNINFYGQTELHQTGKIREALEKVFNERGLGYELRDEVERLDVHLSSLLPGESYKGGSKAVTDKIDKKQ